MFTTRSSGRILREKMYPLQEVDAEEGGGRLIHGGRLIRTLRYYSNRALSQYAAVSSQNETIIASLGSYCFFCCLRQYKTKLAWCCLAIMCTSVNRSIAH